MNYRMAYALGFHPWEDLIDNPRYAGALEELVAGSERNGGSRGRALDIGTGSGVWGVWLARRGWTVTGIDTVERALSRAHERAAQAGVVIELKQADVTALHEAGIGSGFDLLLDTGTFHGLRDEQRTEMGSAVTAVAAPGATLILDCFAPRRRGPLPRGAGRADVQAAFPEWDLVDERAADFCPDRLARMMRFEERFYRLRRR